MPIYIIDRKFPDTSGELIQPAAEGGDLRMTETNLKCESPADLLRSASSLSPPCSSSSSPPLSSSLPHRRPGLRESEALPDPYSGSDIKYVTSVRGLVL
ncbi:neprilysin isoform X2 [Lates japonicus]|uniref:Neprilysin isoform X2 n=1 Tax=Lates japonicus TaxID=270547 RepID=A0AAD3RP19_LATJO|nr:neprilysin isoform X2 [Lates japonicus]